MRVRRRKRKFKRRCKQRKKAGRKISRRINCICRAAFMKIATRTKVREKLWLLTNTPSSWIPDLHARGLESRARIPGSPGLPLKADKTFSTRIWLAGGQ